MFVVAMGVEMLHRMSVVRAWPLVAAFCIMAFIMTIVIVPRVQRRRERSAGLLTDRFSHGSRTRTRALFRGV